MPDKIIHFLKTSLAILLWFCSQNLSAQLYTGRVLNQNGRGISFAVVSQHTSKQKLLSDIDGYFTITKDTAGLFIQHPFYQAKAFNNWAKTNSDTIIFYLTQPKEIGIKTTNAEAKVLLKKINTTKALADAERNAFSYHAYHKLTLSARSYTDNGFFKRFKNKSIENLQNNATSLPHFFVLESVTRRDFIPNKQDREAVIATNATGIKQAGMLAPNTRIHPFNFYKTQLSIPFYHFISPLGSRNLQRYNFEISDTLYVGKQRVYQVSFKPKLWKNFEALEGSLFILADNLMLVAIVARESTNKKTYLELAQSYQATPKSIQVPKVLRLSTELSTSTTAEAYLAETTTYIKDFSFNNTHAAHKFDPIFLTSKEATDSASAQFWMINRKQAFTKNDYKTYQAFADYGKQRDINKAINLSEKLWFGTIALGKVDIVLSQLLRYNEYEGFRPGLGLQTNQNFSENVMMHAYTGYGINDQKWKHDFQIKTRFDQSKNIWFGIRQFREVEESGKQRLAFETEQFDSEKLRNLRLRKKDKTEGISLFAEAKPLHWLTYFAAINQTERSPLFYYKFNTTEQARFYFFEPVLAVRIGLKESFIETKQRAYSLGSPLPVISFQQTAGIKAFGIGQYWYYKTDVLLTYSVRLAGLGKTSVQLAAGKVIGKVPYPILYNGKGSLRNPSVVIHNSFETMQYNEFLSDQFAALYFSHQFGKLLIRHRSFEPSFELLHNMGFGSLHNPELHQGIEFKTMQKGYFETGMFANDLLVYRLLLLRASFGTGLMVRYGPYAHSNTFDNVIIKLSLKVGL